MGAAGYDQDQPTTMLRPQDPAGQTSMLPPMNPDDGGYGYDDRGDRRRGGGQKKSNTSTILLVLAAVLVLVGAIFIGKAMFSGNKGGGTTPVPNLVGKTLKEAKAYGRNGTFKVAEGGRKSCDNVKKGQVTSQKPAAGGEIPKNETVTVTLCSGATKVTVPDVKGLTFQKAADELSSKGFDNVKQTQKVSDRTPGTVIDQDPPGQSEATKNTQITLTVAQESPKRNVPDVKGQAFEAAEKQLRDNGFEVSKTEQEVTDPNQVGKVLDQSPVGNTQAKIGSTVTLTVGKAGAQTPVPGVVGRTLKEAKQALQQAGFTNLQLAGGSSQEDNARVINQDPQPNTPSDPKATTVTLTTVGGGGNGGNGNGGFIGGPFGGDG